MFQIQSIRRRLSASLQSHVIETSMHIARCHGSAIRVRNQQADMGNAVNISSRTTYLEPSKWYQPTARHHSTHTTVTAATIGDRHQTAAGIKKNQRMYPKY